MDSWMPGRVTIDSVVGGKMLKFCPVNPGSKAALRGIREGDFITSINNQSTKDITNAEAHSLLRNSGDTLKLGLNEDTNRSPKRRQYKTVHQETHSETLKKSSVTSYTVTSLETSNHNGTSKPPCSSSSSSTSTYTSLPSPSGMADNGRSRRKKSKNQRKKNKYQVESPKRIKSPERKKMIKSRSLDDDSVKIEELTEHDEKTDSSTHSTALVLEVESDQELADAPLMSPEEELTLRNFLEGLNLVKSPEEALGQVHSTIESVKSRRAQKRAALEQYFNPIVQNPRFLDVISEETSDLSDREQHTITHHLKQGTPEPEVTPKLRKRRRIFENPVLVGTRIIEVPNVEQIASTSLVEGSTRAEVVFLEDSSPEEVGELTPPPTPKNEKVFAISCHSSLNQIAQKNTDLSRNVEFEGLSATSSSEMVKSVPEFENLEVTKSTSAMVEQELETSPDLPLVSNLEETSERDQFCKGVSTPFEETTIQKVQLDLRILPVSTLEASKSKSPLVEELSTNVELELRNVSPSLEPKLETIAKECIQKEPFCASETPQLEQLATNTKYGGEFSKSTSKTSVLDTVEVVDCIPSVSVSSISKECKSESNLSTNSSSKISVENQESILGSRPKLEEQLSTDAEYESESSKSTSKPSIKSTFDAEENQKGSGNSSFTARESFHSVDFVPTYATSSISKRYKSEPILEEQLSSSSECEYSSSISKISVKKNCSTEEGSKSTSEKTSKIFKSRPKSVEQLSTDAEYESESSKSTSKPPVRSTLGAEENQKGFTPFGNSSFTAKESFHTLDVVPSYATSSISKRYKSEPILEEQLSRSSECEYSSSISKISVKNNCSTEESFKSTSEKTSKIFKSRPKSEKQLSTDAEYESESSKFTSKPPVRSALGAEENQKGFTPFGNSSFTAKESFYTVDFVPSYATSSISKRYKSEPTLEQLTRNSECESSSSISKISVGKIFNSEQNQERFSNSGGSEKTSQNASSISQISKNLKSVEQLSTDTEYESESSKSTSKTSVNRTISKADFIPSSNSKTKVEEQLTRDTEYESESSKSTSVKRTVNTESLPNLRNSSFIYNEIVQKDDFVPISSKMSKSEQFLTNKGNYDEISKSTFNQENQRSSKPSSKVIIHKIDLEPIKTVPEPNPPKTEKLFKNLNSFSISKISKSEQVSTTKGELSKSTFNKENQNSSKPFSNEIIHKIELEPTRTEPKIFDPFSPTKIVEDSKSFSTSKISKSEQISTNKDEFSKSTLNKENQNRSKPFSREVIHKIELESTKNEPETEELFKNFDTFPQTKIVEDSRLVSTSKISKSEQISTHTETKGEFSKSTLNEEYLNSSKPFSKEIIHKIELEPTKTEELFQTFDPHMKIIEDSKSLSTCSSNFKSEKTLDKHFTNLQSPEAIKPVEIMHKIVLSDDDNNSSLEKRDSKPLEIIHKILRSESLSTNQEKSEISETSNKTHPVEIIHKITLSDDEKSKTNCKRETEGINRNVVSSKNELSKEQEKSEITETPKGRHPVEIIHTIKRDFGVSPDQERSEIVESLSQITESPSKEVEILCLTPLPQVSTNILSPPAPSRSPSSGSSTSFCTIAEITSNPQTLRQICLHFLLSQPFGAAVLQELADVSSSLQRLTTSTSQFISSRDFSPTRNMNSARLQARDLTEWLQLARNKNRNDRRISLPDAQMLYLQQKEQEIETELKRLEEEKQRLEAEMEQKFRIEDFHISKRGDFAESKKRPVSLPPQTEHFRQEMYNEYMAKIAQMEQRKLQKHIKVSQLELTTPETKPSGISDEFMSKVRLKQQLGKLQKLESESEHEDDSLPKHLQEFVEFGVWSPGQKQDYQPQERQRQVKDEPISPVWTPKSATSSPTVEKKEFRPVKFESPVLSRKNPNKTEEGKEPPWKSPETSSDTGITLSSTLEKRLPTSQSAPVSGFCDFPATRLPKAQNPTITLLQKAREGQLPKGALYIEEQPPFVGPGEILYKIKSEYTSQSDSEKPRKMADLGPRKFEGIGPTTKEGMPLILRSEVKDANQSKWYKKMYDTIHKQKPHRDEFVTIKYKQRRGNFPYSSGYLSEPEPGAYDSDYTDYKYATLDRRRQTRDKENDYSVATMPRSVPETIIKHGHDPYKNQPGRIENYIPGRSSISEKEAKEWWDEVMDIFDGHLEQQKRVPPQTKSFINQALKESGYESDSTLVFRRRDESTQLSPSEQKEAYKIIQKGGDIPLHGLRKPAPERPKDVEPEVPVPPPKGLHARGRQQESPRKYVENEVTIHYKTPVRQEIKEYLSEDELAHRQAEAMKKIYQEERRRKYLQELQDMNNRRHTDNFIPSQKSPIPLNRYDDFDGGFSPPVKPRPKSPEPRLMARALYNFVGQTARELTFRKGDLIYVRRQVDKNWYEGELNAMVGLFPVNYVEIVPYDTAKSTPRKSYEGQARAKYNFVAQTHLELSLAKGELVIITRRVDDNWFEGKIGGRKGIFPVSYVEVLIDPSDPPPPSSKPVASPAAHSLLLNGSAGGKESMGSHSYTPALSTNKLTSSYHAKPVQVSSYGSLNRGGKSPVNQALHIETQSEPVPYRALYKYLPQNDDELELLEGDTVYVLEKCDDGWYVGSSDRTGAFGTFPGNYVEKI